MTDVTNWYRKKNIFVTGATGFVGKCLVEKLIRDCPDIGDVYIMIRSKKNTDFEQRKKAYVNHVVFSRLTSERPSALDKIKIVKGDLNEVDFGIGEQDRREICDRVSVVFHVAADVRFDKELWESYDVNVTGTKHALDFASCFKRLEVFVHVSTTYSQTHHSALEERYYPPTIPFQEMDIYRKHIDVDVLNALTHKLLDRFPNTYSFTKSISEDLVEQYKDKLPIAIGRPAIIIMSWKEPMVGYTEGIHGINGWCLAVGRGVLRTMHCQHHYNCNVMPCDVIVNGLAVLAYERAKLKSNEPLYFNIAESKPMNWHSYLTQLQPGFFKFPYDYALWYPGGSLKKNAICNFVCELLFHIFPALLINILLLIFRQRPIMMHIRRKITSGVQTLHCFMNNPYRFKTDRYNEAMAGLSDEDRKIFYDKSNMDMAKYFEGASYGIRTYFVKDKPEDLPRARKFYEYLKILDRVSKTLIVLWIIFIVVEFVDKKLFRK